MSEAVNKTRPESKKSVYPFLLRPIPITEQRWDVDIEPLVSIYCKTFMHEKFIRDAIEGFLIQQTTFKVEIWIHDDASTDNTANIIREYVGKYPQLFVATYQVENQYKRKPQTPKYIVPPKLRGKYIAPCEGDDYWTDYMKLQKQVDFMENSPDYVMCYHQNLQRKEDKLFSTPIPVKGIDYSADELIATPSGIATATKFFRNVFLNQNPIEEKPSGDYGLNAYLGLYGKCKFLSSVKPSVRRLHSGGVWTSKPAQDKHYGVIDNKINIYRFFRKRNDKHRISISLKALFEIIEKKIPELDSDYKKFEINKKRILVSFQGLKLNLEYRLFLSGIKRRFSSFFRGH